MSEIITDGTARVPTELDDLYDKMSEFVCAHGPLLLTRGMSPLEANQAIMSCLELLYAKSDAAQRLIMELRCYNAGMSVLSEEAVQTIVKEFENA